MDDALELFPKTSTIGSKTGGLFRIAISVKRTHQDLGHAYQ